MQNAYQVLGVSRNADLDTINSAFKKIAIETHVNGVCVKRDQYEQASQAVRILRNPESRNKLDSELIRTRPDSVPEVRLDISNTKKPLSPRMGGIKEDLGDMLSTMFADTFPIRQSNDFNLTIPDVILIAALVDSYKNPRNGCWIVKDNDAGKVIYRYELRNGKPDIIINFEHSEVSAKRFMTTLDNLAYKMATETGRFDISLELQRINDYNLNPWIKTPGEVYKCSLTDFQTRVEEYGRRFEFISSEVNFHSKEKK